MDARWHATWWDNCVSFCETKQSGIKGVKRYFDPTDIHELLRFYATFAILKTFGFADFP